MTIKFRLARWNNTTNTKRGYHAKPTIAEIKKARTNINKHGNGILRRKGGELILVTPNNYVEVKATVGNSLSANRYIDLYQII